MWIMLMHKMAPAAVTGQWLDAASSITGGLMFVRPLSCVHAAMLWSAASSGSDGWKVRPGRPAQNAPHARPIRWPLPVQARRREDTAQHIENGVAVACGGRVFKAVIGHGALDVNAG
jgi:hypothetical protein